MTYKVEFSAGARRDAREAQQWYDNRAPGLGLKFSAALIRQSASLASMPEMYKVVRDGIHRCSIPKFPYEMYYRVEELRVVVLVVHAVRQDPDRIIEKLKEQ